MHAWYSARHLLLAIACLLLPVWHLVISLRYPLSPADPFTLGIMSRRVFVTSYVREHRYVGGTPGRGVNVRTHSNLVVHTNIYLLVYPCTARKEGEKQAFVINDS